MSDDDIESHIDVLVEQVKDTAETLGVAELEIVSRMKTEIEVRMELED
jgi:hypothetical protein